MQLKLVKRPYFELIGKTGILILIVEKDDPTTVQSEISSEDAEMKIGIFFSVKR